MGAFSGIIKFVCFLASLVIGKKEKTSLCNSLGFMPLFLSWLFIRVVLRHKFIELGSREQGVSCLRRKDILGSAKNFYFI